jgi:hypothetical protein
MGRLRFSKDLKFGRTAPAREIRYGLEWCQQGSVSGLTKIGNKPVRRRGKLSHGMAAWRGLYEGKSFDESRV